MYLKYLRKCFALHDEQITIKTKKQKLEEYEQFKISNIEPVDNFSDDVMGKTAEEMYKEDMEKKRSQVEDEINCMTGSTLFNFDV